MNWLRQLLSRRALYNDLHEELEQHLAMKTDELIAKGMTPEQARHAARKAFGNVSLIEERGREAWQWPIAESIWADIRFAVRQLKKSPGFTVAAVLTLSLGIGANTAIFSIIDRVLLHPVPYAQSDRLAIVTESSPQMQQGEEFGVSAGEYLDYRDHNSSFSRVAAFESAGFNLTGSGEPLRVNAARVSPSVFPLLDVSAERGRTFTSEEEQRGKNSVVLLSDSLWKHQFHADPHILGRAIRLDDTPYTVVGIMPASFRFPFDGAPFSELADLWVPETFNPGLLDPQNRVMEFGIGLIGKLKPGVTREQAQVEVNHIAADFMKQYPQSYAGTMHVVPKVYSFASTTNKKSRTLVLLLASAVLCILLIACANVANLLLARASHRTHEMAIRSAIGGQRIRLLRQCLVESLLLSLMGSVAGILLAFGLLLGLKHFGPANIPGLKESTLHPLVLGFTLGLSFLTSMLFGFVPAWRLSRTAPQTCLKERHLIGSGGKTQRLQNSLVVTEIAVALILLISGGLLIRSFQHLVNSPFGFDPNGGFIVRTLFDRARYPNATKRQQVQQALLEQLSQIPGVRSVALASHLPLSDSRKIGFSLEHASADDFHFAENSLISPNYFKAMGIPLVRGRDFSSSDRPDTTLVAIINESLAREYFPGQDPIGQRLHWGDRALFTVIGIAADVHVTALDAEPRPMIYHDMFQVESGASGRTAMILRSSEGRQALLAQVQQRIWALDKDLPLYHTTTLATLVSESLAQRRFMMILLSAFAALALVLASVGLFGVVSYLVAERQAEFGIRIAMGAERKNIYLLVLRKGGMLGIIGCTLGLLSSIFTGRLLATSLYQVTSYDAFTLSVVPLLLLGVVLLAAFWPARRAAAVDPMLTLRGE